MISERCEAALDLYPTRLAEETVIERTDPVVYGSPRWDENSLSVEELEFFRRNGYLKIENVFSQSECEALLADFARLEREHGNDGREEFVYEPNSDDLRSIFSPHKFSPLFDRLCREERILKRVEQILGSLAYLMHSRVNIKPAFHGKAFDWHSDFETWHAEDGIPAPRIVTGWVMLTDNTEYNGPLFAIPGSHKTFIGCKGKTPKDNYKTSLRKQRFGVPSPETVKALYDKGGAAAITGKAGTIVFHECNLLHASPDNISPRPRTNAMFVYNSVDNPPAFKPYAANDFRPEFLSSSDKTPLRAARL